MMIKKYPKSFPEKEKEKEKKIKSNLEGSIKLKKNSLLLRDKKNSVSLEKPKLERFEAKIDSQITSLEKV